METATRTLTIKTGQPLAPFAPTMVAMAVVGVLMSGQLYAVLPLFHDMAASWHTTAGATTWTATTGGLAYAAGFLIWGPLSDRFGRRRVITSGVAVSAVATLAVAAAPSLLVACGMRIVQGLAAAAFAPAAFAYIGERIAPQRRSLALTIILAAFLSSSALGQIIGQTVSAAAGWRAVFVVWAIAVAIALAGLRLILLPDGARGRASLAGAFATMGRLAVTPRFVPFYAAYVAIMAAFVGIYAALQLAGPHGVAGNSGALLTLRSATLPALAIVPMGAPLLRHVAARHRAQSAVAAAGLAAVALTVVGGNLLMLSLLLMVIAGGIAVTAPALMEIVSSRAGEARGAVSALLTFSVWLGGSIGPQLVIILQSSGFATIVLVIAGLLLSSAAMIRFGTRRAAEVVPLSRQRLEKAG